RIGPDGIITTVAGTVTNGFSGDGGQATDAMLNLPEGVAVAPDGSLYIADYGNSRIRRVGPDGIISTVAGTGQAGFGGDGGPGTQALLFEPEGVAVAPDGNLYIADFKNHRIRRVAKFLPGFSFGDTVISSATGSELYRFNVTGRHVQTVDAFT